MTLIQWLLMAALALVGIGMLLSVSLITAAFVNHRKEVNAEQSLLARLEEATRQIKPGQPRPKYYKDWGQM